MQGDLAFADSGGPAGAVTLLLVHPMGADRRFWDACVAVWRGRYRCIAVDLRGCGASPAAQGAIPVPDHASALAAFITRHGFGPVVPVGCAVGAMIATALAGMQGDLTRALVVSNPGTATQPGARAALRDRAEQVRKGGMQAVIPAAIDIAFAGCRPDAARQVWAERFAALDPAAYALQIEGILDAEITPFLAAIACPTLIVAGGQDRLLQPDHARLIHRALPQSELAEVPDGAHFIPYQRPAEFAGLVSGFLDRVL
ncbi:MAG: alpha/beta hydrolase [Gemmobacter sp.]|nr:alpha/beta hydrolase [Gemmobacter sp.]